LLSQPARGESNDSRRNPRHSQPAMNWSELFPLRFVVEGEPCSYKNSKQIITVGKRSRLLPSTKSRKWMDKAVKQLEAQWSGPPVPKDLELNAAIVSYLPTRRKTDADNLYGGPGDALQRSGIIEDDCSQGTIPYSVTNGFVLIVESPR